MPKGENHWNWKGGITPFRKKSYFSEEYKSWRKAVFERDNYTCISCKKRGFDLSVDHIKPWSEYPELRFELSNGRTLCLVCHRKTHTWGKWDYRKLCKKRIGKINSGCFKKGHVGYKGQLGKRFILEHKIKLRISHLKYFRNKNIKELSMTL